MVETRRFSGTRTGCSSRLQITEAEQWYETLIVPRSNGALAFLYECNAHRSSPSRESSSASAQAGGLSAFSACVTTIRSYNAEGSLVIFEWDEFKRLQNLRKHGFDFRDCAAVFEGPTLVTPDDRFQYGETRFKAYGLLRDRAVVVVCAEAAAEAIRVVSMRKATRHEQTQYFESLQN
ncbi:MAG: BrnT family toxin [Gammaproteobacteria bacterium]